NYATVRVLDRPHAPASVPKQSGEGGPMQISRWSLMLPVLVVTGVAASIPVGARAEDNSSTSGLIRLAQQPNKGKPGAPPAAPPAPAGRPAGGPAPAAVHTAPAFHPNPGGMPHIGRAHSGAPTGMSRPAGIGRPAGLGRPAGVIPSGVAAGRYAIGRS